MLRSLFTAVTGVRAHQTMLDVTGNNISNANTTGFKKDNTIFADLMYQANKYASGAGDSRGGINPAQVGLGVSVSAIETIHTQGSGQFTGNNSDMMIQDKGFFVYREGTQELYSRSGACVLDGNSDMVMSGSGYKLQGYEMELQPASGDYQQAAELSTVNIPLGQKIDAKATTQVDYQCNLNSESDAYLPYGFADLPFNALAGWKNNSNGTAVIDMNGTEYEMSFTSTGVKSAAAVYNDGDAGANAGTGINYLNIDIVNSGATTTLTFDMIDVDKDSGLPVLNLPRIDTNDMTSGTPAVVMTTTPTVPATNGFVGWIASDGITFVDAASTLPAVGEDTSGYLPVYEFPGKNPPQYFAVEYDDNSGAMRFREVEYTPANPGDPIDSTTSTNISVRAAVFTYNLKDNMNYTNFQLKGSPSENNVPPEAMTNNEVTYNFVAEFDESTTRGSNDISSLGQTQSKMKLWYYGYCNDDIAAGTPATLNANAVQKMHRLDALVNFNADGSFESVEWETADGEAPAGYHIDNWTSQVGNPPVATPVGPNFQIAVGSASAGSSLKDTLNFKQAKDIDSPGSLDDDGLWKTAGTTYQGGFHSTKCTIYDDNGKTHTLEVTFKKLTENRWRWEAFLVEKDEDSGEDKLVNIIPEPHSGEIEFDGSGRISNAISDSTDGQRRGDGNDRFPNAEVEISIPFSLNGQPNSVVTLNFGGGVGKGGENIDGVTQFASETTTKPIYQDGYTMGVLKNYSVAVDGVITGSYDNGVNIPLYRVALATFANEQGLEKVGNTMFRATVNSGNANIDGATTNGKGSIMSQYVEMSNVDLTEEFTHLIIAQRGFQANTRVVTVSDQILEEVVNLKR
ncbi:MAG: flagellar hook-basal body complex protein [Synergistaceae bacterium]|nr:flagellar hook-basal body complex protein [Synergistaceae bacterium]